jgi:hypothetical protein
MTATLSDDEWAKLSQNVGKSVVRDPGASSGTTFGHSLGRWPSGSDAKSSNQPDTLHSHQGTPGTSYAAGYGLGSAVKISMMPNSFVVSIPFPKLGIINLFSFSHIILRTF